MKKHSLFLLVFIFHISYFTTAQITSNYNFTSNNTASLENMSAGTQQLIGPSLSNAASAIVPIGFDFWFLGTRYSSFSANCNGALQLGATQILANYIGVNFLTTNKPTIAPFFGNFNTSSSGKIHYKVFGTFPSRKLLVEFLNLGANASSTTADVSFQVALYENSGVIEYTYGNMKIGNTAGVVNSRKVVIGFGIGNTANQLLYTSHSPAFVSFTNTPVTPVDYNFIGNIAGLSSIADGSRIQFKYSPPVRLAPTNLIISNITYTSMSLAWTDNSSGLDNELGFAIYKSEDNGTTYSFYASTPADSTSYTATNLSVNTPYLWKVYSFSEGALSLNAASAGPIPTLACSGMATNTANLNAVVGPILSWTNLPWSLNHVPTPCENAEIILNVPATATLDADIEIDLNLPSITVNNLKISNVSSTLKKITLKTSGSTIMNILGDLEITSPGANKYNRAVFTNTNTTNIFGNVILGNPSPSATEGHAAIGSGEYIFVDQTYNLMGNIIFNPRSYTIDEKAIFNFNKQGTQYIVNNTRNLLTDTSEAMLFEDLRVGSTNATTLIFSGTNYNTFIETAGRRGITIGNNSVLDLPKNYSLNVINNAGALPSYLKMLSGSRLRIGGDSSAVNFHSNPPNNITGVAGSNFPNIRGTGYFLDPTSTIEYYGGCTTPQTIYNQVPYAILVVNNGGGTCRATKKSIAPLVIKSKLDIDYFIDFNVSSTMKIGN